MSTTTESLLSLMTVPETMSPSLRESACAMEASNSAAKLSPERLCASVVALMRCCFVDLALGCYPVESTVLSDSPRTPLGGPSILGRNACATREAEWLAPTRRKRHPPQEAVL